MSEPHAADELFASLLDGMPQSADRRHAQQLLRAAVDLVQQHPDTLDLKIAAAALQEMGDAFEMFAHAKDAPKVSIFGSARTLEDDPLYLATKEVAYRLAVEGWMVITGAGPGIMQAGMEGAGRENSIGVSIRLPFEQGANHVIEGDSKYVSMKYFFTRKLMLIKESLGFVCLPGGFGTLDELFEALTLIQTGKIRDFPVVLMGHAYWDGLLAWMRDVQLPAGAIAQSDLDLLRVTDDPVEAVALITAYEKANGTAR